MKVRFQRGTKGSWSGFVARVIAGPANMVGRDYRFAAENGTSCVGLGSREGYIVVRRRTASNAAGIFLPVLDFKPTFFNELQRFLGGHPWRFPGKHVNDTP